MTGAEIAGTRHYAAPEQLGELPGGWVGKWSDVYGWARTCCYALFQNAEPTFQNYKKIPDVPGGAAGPVPRAATRSTGLPTSRRCWTSWSRSSRTCRSRNRRNRPAPPPPPHGRSVVTPAPAPAPTPAVLPLTADEEKKIAWRTAERNGTAESYERVLRTATFQGTARRSQRGTTPHGCCAWSSSKTWTMCRCGSGISPMRTPAECEADWQRMPAFLKLSARALFSELSHRAASDCHSPCESRS